MKTFVKFGIAAALSAISACAAPAQAASYQTPVSGNYTLNIGDYFVSGDGRFHLLYQADNNLVLYEGTTALWASNTSNANVAPVNEDLAVRTLFQSDGNLVVYSCKSTGPDGCSYANEFSVWASHTAGNTDAILDVQNDGNVVIKTAAGKALWATNTAGH